MILTFHFHFFYLAQSSSFSPHMLTYFNSYHLPLLQSIPSFILKPFQLYSFLPPYLDIPDQIFLLSFSPVVFSDALFRFSSIFLLQVLLLVVRPTVNYLVASQYRCLILIVPVVSN